jgi:small-conductance mechanosensitive channel
LFYDIQTETWSFGHRVVYYGLFISSIILTLSMWLVWMFLTAFDLLPVGGGVVLSFFTLFTAWTVLFCRSGLLFPSQYHYKPKNRPFYLRKIFFSSLITLAGTTLRLWSFAMETKHKIVKRPIVFTTVAIVLFFLAFVSCFFLTGLCVCGDPDYTSTRYTRSRMDPPCSTLSISFFCY